MTFTLEDLLSRIIKFTELKHFNSMQNKIQKFDAVIIGGGAAGMMCAIQAAQRGKSVLIVEHTKKVGEKIRISGGGRCNFTNLHISSDNFLSNNSRFATSALSRFNQHDFISLVEAASIPYHEKTLGQLFCDGSASQIIAMLTEKMIAGNVTIKLCSIVKSIERNDNFKIILDDSIIEATSLVIACGGKSIPKIGASNFGYLVAEQFDLNIIPTRPALVPLVFTNLDLTKTKPLAGISLQASVSCEKTRFDEGFLFTHKGLSGPSILQISSYWQEGKNIDINLCPNIDLLEKLMNMRIKFGRKQIETVLSEFIPSRLAHIITKQSEITGKLADQSKKNLQAIAQLIQHWTLKPSGSEGYRTAEVTLGGINTDELNSKTMESKKVKGLYFIGEVVDVTGWLGGYNFQWAWSSGWAAGKEL